MLEIPAQLTLLDAEAAELLGELLISPAFPPEMRVTAEGVAQPAIDLVGRCNSRETLLACVACLLVARDTRTLSDGFRIEKAVVSLRAVINRARREPDPGWPKWLKVVQLMLAHETEEDDANRKMKRQRQASKGEPISDEPVLSCAQAGKAKANGEVKGMRQAASE